MEGNKKRRDQETMFAMIREWESSNQTKKGFSKSRDIPISVFLYWCRKYRESHSPSGFVPIEVNGFSDPGTVIEIRYPSGITLRLPVGTPLPVVRAYLQI